MHHLLLALPLLLASLAATAPHTHPGHRSLLTSRAFWLYNTQGPQAPLDLERLAQQMSWHTRRRSMAGNSSNSKQPSNSSMPPDSVEGSSVQPSSMGAGNSMQPSKPSKPSAAALQLRAFAELPWEPDCPAWIAEYAAFHKKAVADYGKAGGGAPMQAKLMMHECIGEHTLSSCPGIGDRVRGLSETFRFAVQSKRVFLLRWEADAPLEDVLQPSLIDWRVKPQYKVDDPKTSKQWLWWHKSAPMPASVLDNSFLNFSDDVLSLTHPYQFCRPSIKVPDIGCPQAIPPHLRSCVFQALFKASDKLAATVATLRKQLFGSDDAPYVAVHLRIGGFEGERKIMRGGLASGNHSTEEVVATTLSAAQALASASNITAPVLVITDNDELRTRLQEGKLRGFVSPPYKAKHAATARFGQHKEALATSFQDLALLAGARCFIGSPSGFTVTALLWGRHTCYLMVDALPYGQYGH